MADWKVDVSGEILIERGQIAITVNSAEEAKQNIIFRLQTSLMDYQPNPDLGVGLDQFIGLPNIEDTGTAIQEQVARSLTTDDLFPADSLQIEVVPLGAHEIGVYVFHVPPAVGNFEPVTVSATLNLISGDITFITG